MSLLLFYRSNYWVRRKPEYRPPEAPKKRKRAYRVVYDKRKAEAFPVDLVRFASEIKEDIAYRVRKKRQQEEEVIVLLDLFN